MPEQLLLIPILALAALGLRAVLEPHWLELTGYRLRRPDAATPSPATRPKPRDGGGGRPVGRSPRAPSRRARLRLAFLATTTRSGCSPAGRASSTPDRGRSDIVVFGGDLSSKPRDKARGLEDFAYYGAALEAAGIPFIGIRGNHDTTLTRAEAEATGMIWLANEHYVIERGGRRWAIVGLDDERIGAPDIAAALEGLTVEPAQRLVFAHNPDSVLRLRPGEQAHVFSGHYHGGQIRAPGHFEFHHLRPDDRLSGHGYYKGLYDWEDFTLFISRGIGCVLFPLRFLNRPELTIFDIEAS